MSLEIPRPVDPSLHPLMTGNYRIATPAIEEFYELVARCLRYRVMVRSSMGRRALARLGRSNTFDCSLHATIQG